MRASGASALRNGGKIGPQCKVLSSLGNSIANRQERVDFQK